MDAAAGHLAPEALVFCPDCYSQMKASPTKKNALSAPIGSGARSTARRSPSTTLA